MVAPMNANQPPSFQSDHKSERGKSKSPINGGSTVVFKRSFNINSLNEQDRLAARALLQRLISSNPARPQP